MIKKTFVRLAAGVVLFSFIILLVVSTAFVITGSKCGGMRFSLCLQNEDFDSFADSFTADPIKQHTRFVSRDMYVSSDDEVCYLKYDVYFFAYTVILAIMYSAALKIKDKLSRCSFRLLI